MKHGIMIVDDNAMAREPLCSTLRSANLNVVGETGCGKTAIAMAERLRPDIVFLDIFMGASINSKADSRMKCNFE